MSARKKSTHCLIISLFRRFGDVCIVRSHVSGTYFFCACEIPVPVSRNLRKLGRLPWN